MILGLVAVVGLYAWPRLGAGVSHKAQRQAECGLLNYDCGQGGSSASGGGPKAAP